MSGLHLCHHYLFSIIGRLLFIVHRCLAIFYAVYIEAIAAAFACIAPQIAAVGLAVHVVPIVLGHDDVIFIRISADQSAADNTVMELHVPLA